jgi:hypothetical protein
MRRDEGIHGLMGLLQIVTMQIKAGFDRHFPAAQALCRSPVNTWKMTWTMRRLANRCTLLARRKLRSSGQGRCRGRSAWPQGRWFFSGSLFPVGIGRIAAGLNFSRRQNLGVTINLHP